MNIKTNKFFSKIKKSDFLIELIIFLFFVLGLIVQKSLFGKNEEFKEVENNKSVFKVWDVSNEIENIRNDFNYLSGKLLYYYVIEDEGESLLENKTLSPEEKDFIKSYYLGNKVSLFKRSLSGGKEEKILPFSLFTYSQIKKGHSFFSFSPDFKKIVYSEWNNVAIYDLEKESTLPLIELKNIKKITKNVKLGEMTYFDNSWLTRSEKTLNDDYFINPKFSSDGNYIFIEGLKGVVNGEFFSTFYLINLNNGEIKDLNIKGEPYCVFKTFAWSTQNHQYFLVCKNNDFINFFGIGPDEDFYLAKNFTPEFLKEFPTNNNYISLDFSGFFSNSGNKIIILNKGEKENGEEETAFYLLDLNKNKFEFLFKDSFYSFYPFGDPKIIYSLNDRNILFVKRNFKNENQGQLLISFDLIEKTFKEIAYLPGNDWYPFSWTSEGYLVLNGNKKIMILDLENKKVMGLISFKDNEQFFGIFDQ